MERKWVAVAASILLLAGCGGAETGEPLDQGFDARAGLDAEGDLKVIVVPGADLAGSNLTLSCPNGPMFPASALSEIPLIGDSGLTGVDEAIDPFLSSDEDDFWPQDGWRVLHSTEDLVQLVHLADPAPLDGAVSTMSAQGSDGAWAWSGASGASPCPLKTTLPAGLGNVAWELDPSAPTPDASATSFRVLATERRCVSGQGMGERLLGPEIVVTDDAVLVAFAAEPPPGEFHECPGNPSVAVTIELDKPLGDREILDGLDVGVDLSEFINQP